MSHQAKLRSAAVLVASLDRKRAERLLEQLGPEMATQVRQAVLELKDIDPREQQAALDALMRAGRKSVRDNRGVELAGSLAHQLGSSATMSQAPAPPVQSPHNNSDSASVSFEFLRDTRPERLVPLLLEEHPQTIALVLGHLPPDRAVQCLDQLPSGLQADVIRRLARQGQANSEMVREVAAGLHARISQYATEDTADEAGMRIISRMLAAGDRRQRRSILSHLGDTHTRVSRDLVPQKLRFVDLQLLDDVNLGRLLDEAGPRLMGLALIGVESEFTERVLAYYSPLVARELRNRLHHLEPLRLSDVEAAQQELLDIAESLESAGFLHFGVGSPSLRLAA